MGCMSEQDTVSFGFETVTPDEKVDRVKGVFRSVASKYDVMNDFMSVGIHRLWKHDTMNRVNPQPGEKHLDVAGGTGELARAFLTVADAAENGAAIPVTQRRLSAISMMPCSWLAKPVMIMPNGVTA